MTKIKQMTEIWKDIKGYIGFYQVSNYGKVRSLTRKIIHKNGKIRIYNGTLIIPHTVHYPRVHLRRNGESIGIMVHHLVCGAFIGLRPINKEVNHIDGVKTNNKLINLEYLTRSENARHAYKIGLQKPSHKSKYSDIKCLQCSKLFRPVRKTNACCSNLERKICMNR